MDPAEAPAAIEFGRFRVLPHRRELLAEGRPVELGGRAFDMLMALMEASGSIVSKDALMSRVWPDRTVDDNNLQTQISALRKALGADRNLIRTIAGRGYQFTGMIRTIPGAQDAQAIAGLPQSTPKPPHPPTNLPEPISELIGRDVELAAILDLSASHRLVTLSGAGGIGKTRLGFEVARHLLPKFADGVWVVELAPLSDPELVPGSVATALALELTGTASPLSVANALRSRQLLLVLDNCEHMIDAAAQMTDALLRGNSAAQVIATSREPLQIDGEWVYAVPPLAVPAAASPADEDPLRYGAVRLFVERAQAVGPQQLASEAGVLTAIAAICRRLDGIPLAIELAAARTAALGVEGVASRLDDRFRLLSQGRRTALPRHQTLRATMDWSYALLPAVEQVILRRLAVFQGDFTMDAAQAVATTTEIAAAQVFEGVGSLAAKSLVARDIGGPVAYYRLLDTTRAYACDKLVDAEEIDAVRRLHAEYYRDLFAKAEAEAATWAAGEWREDYAHQIGNLRAALNWAFSETGDTRLGVTLASVATDFWLTLSLLSECCDWGMTALAHLGTAEGTRYEMVLQGGLGLALTYVRGMVPEARSALTRALTLSEALGNFGYRFRALYGLWLFALRVVDFRECLALAHQHERLADAVGDPVESAVADWMLGMSRYYLAEHAGAAANLQRARASYPRGKRSGDLIRFGVHMHVSALGYQAVTFWSLGLADSAMEAGRDAIQEAREVNHPVSLCIALNLNGLLLVKTGDLERAQRCIDELIDHAGEHSLIPYHALGLCLKGSLMAARGDLVAAEEWLRSGLERMRQVGYYLFRAFFLSELADVLTNAGRIGEGLAEIDAALRYATESESLWCMPEVLRTKGNVLARHDAPDFAAVESHLAQALDLAHQQGALFWELRAATSRAQLLRNQGRPAEATALLQPVYDRFTEGFVTSDLKAAKALLDDRS